MTHQNHSFNETYKENEELFGHPYQELQDYFTKRSKGSVLDVGCGQGRDALFLASIGYDVTAIDNSHVGVEQMTKKAKEKNLQLQGIVEDVLNFSTQETFDVILFDMLLHSFTKDQQLGLLKKYFTLLKKNGTVCIVFPDDLKTSYFLNLLKSLPYKWELKKEIIVHDVPTMPNEESDFTFIMIIIQYLET